jgi:hypothetical protein
MGIGILNLKLKRNEITSQTCNINELWNYAQNKGSISFTLSQIIKWLLHQSGGQHISEISCSLSHIISVITLVYLGYVYRTLENQHCDQ